MSDWISKLNAAQKQAVTTIQGPLLVLAGAGTGKTRVITVRIAHMLSNGISPDNVLAVTFTNKAASEMRERLTELVGKPSAKRLTVGTFHAFCMRALRGRTEEVGLGSSFTICDAADQQSILKGALRELHIPEATIKPSSLQAEISLQKNKMVTYEEFLGRATDDREELIGRAWRRYDEQLRRSRLVDFDDLLIYTQRLLAIDSVRDEFRQRFQYVLVDEFQDTNAPQYEIVRSICGEHKNLCAVGDDDQSIYGWRGADLSKILGFEHDFPGTVVVRLETNYRSTGLILSAANRVIANNPARHEKKLRSAFEEGEPVRLARMTDEIEEADGIVLEIADSVRRQKTQFRDYAILFRTAQQPRAFEGQLRARAIPYKLVGGMSFFDRKEVRDVMAYLKLVANPLDEASFLRVVNRPARGIGKASIDKALELATQRGVSIVKAFDLEDVEDFVPVAAVKAVQEFRKLLTTLANREVTSGAELVLWVKELIESVGYRSEVDKSYTDEVTREERWRNVMEVLDFAENYARRAKEEPTLLGFLEEMVLSGQDNRDRDKTSDRDQVTLMTVHAAKGLEFPIVYLVGCEEGILPHARSVAEGGVEEERRLMYVGITRAQRRLTLLWAGERSKYGKRTQTMPSRFLFEAKGTVPPEEWIPTEQMAAMEPEERRKAARKAQRKRKKKTSRKRTTRRG